jgi:hypothetical protein
MHPRPRVKPPCPDINHGMEVWRAVASPAYPPGPSSRAVNSAKDMAGPALLALSATRRASALRRISSAAADIRA